MSKTDVSRDQDWLRARVHVAVPFVLLREKYLERLLAERINPEIGLDAEALDRFTPQAFRETARALHDEGLKTTLHAPFMDLSPGSPEPRLREITRDRFHQVLDLVPLFRPLSVVFHTGYDQWRYAEVEDEWVSWSLEAWGELAQKVQEAGSRMVLENVYEPGPGILRRLMERLGEQGVGICLDTGHQSAFSRTSLETWVREMSPWLGQLHLHDNMGREDQHLALGKGGIDFEGFLTYLASVISRPPLITLEPHREEDLWPSLLYLSRLWPWPREASRL